MHTGRPRHHRQVHPIVHDHGSVVRLRQPHHTFAELQE
jgi:hypothetical protein